jgi:hypothetical protein
MLQIASKTPKLPTTKTTTEATTVVTTEATTYQTTDATTDPTTRGLFIGGPHCFKLPFSGAGPGRVLGTV